MKKEKLNYKEMEKFLLNNIKYTYGVSDLLESFTFGMLQSMLQKGMDTDVFETSDKDKFKITIHPIKNEYTTNYFYDIEKL